VAAVQGFNRGVFMSNGKLCYDLCHLCLWSCRFLKIHRLLIV